MLNETRRMRRISTMLAGALLVVMTLVLAACGRSGGGQSGAGDGDIDLNGDWYRAPAVSAHPGAYDPADLVMVAKDNKVGFIDTEGNEVIPCKYEDEMYFDVHGYAVACKDGKYGVINTSDEEIVPFEYDRISLLEEGTDLAIAYKEDNCGFIDMTGGEGIPFAFDDIVYFSDDGFAAVARDEKWGVIDTAGKVIVPLKYELTETQIGGYTLVMDSDKQGLVDSTGAEVLPLKYDQIQVIPNGDEYVFAVYEGNKSSLLAQNGDVLVEFGDQSLEYAYEMDGASVIAADSAGIEAEYAGDAEDVEETPDPWYTLYNTSGEKISETGYNWYMDYGKVIVVETDDGCGLIDRSGNEILPCEYDTMVGIMQPDGSEWPALYEESKGWKVYDNDGQPVESLAWMNGAVSADSDIEITANGKVLVGIWDEEYIDLGGPLTGDMYNADGTKVDTGELRVVLGSCVDDVVIVQDRSTSRFGLMTTSGELIAPCKYGMIESNGLVYGRFFMARPEIEYPQADVFNSRGELISEGEYDDPISVEGTEYDEE